MSQIGKTIKNLEAPRPLKSRSSHQLKSFIVMEELIQLIENVAMTLASGLSNPETMAILISNLRTNGPQLEVMAKDSLDRAFVTFRNASQDERLNIMTRLNLLELIELRAKSWQDDGINLYYKQKASSVNSGHASNAAAVQGYIDSATLLSTSPTTMAGLSLGHFPIAAVATQILAPGEVIRASGKFTKPTKIPGKNYSKDEVVIRNADSGKVMGIKGRRVHMIEELSETIISFQRVNPGAKERLVQITGPNEDKITYAKHLIEDTIRRNASPVRLESSVAMGMSVTGGHGQGGGAAGGGGGSCSSLASSASDETVPRATNSSNRHSIGAMMGGVSGLIGLTTQPNYLGSNYGGLTMMGPGGKILRSAPAIGHHQLLSHSYSTNDASIGEYKYTINIGQHLIKITGDNCELVRIAKLVLDDYFSSNEFLASIEAGATFDGSSSLLGSVVTTPTTPLSAPTYIPSANPLLSSPFADSGIGLNYMASHGIANSNIPEGDDDVFIIDEPSGQSTTQLNGLARSRRSHFSRKDSAPDGFGKIGNKANVSSSAAAAANKCEARIVHEYERLIYYSKSPHSWALPRDWNKIIEKHPSLVRNKVTSDDYPNNNEYYYEIKNNNDIE